MKMHTWKRSLAVLLAAVMIICLGACGRSKKKEDPKPEPEPQEVSTAVEKDTDTSEGITVPPELKTMTYAMEALMVQDHSQGLDYYTSKDKGDDTKADSFYFSMAVLVSLINQESAQTGAGDVATQGQYYLLSENDFDMFAHALYAGYGESFERPDEPAGDRFFKSYEDDTYPFGLIRGKVGNLGIKITRCDQTVDGYEIDADLTDSGQTVNSYQFVLIPTKFQGVDNSNIFQYTVKSMNGLGEETEAAPEVTTEGGTNVSTEDFSDMSGDTNDTASDVTVGDGKTISAQEAEERAKSEYSSNGTYTRDEDVSQDGTDYYHFKVEGENGETSDVLVSKDGNDVVGASKNEDGSWSFNQ